MSRKDAFAAFEARHLAGRFPPSAQDVPGSCAGRDGYAIYLAQRGDKHLSTKPLKGLGSGVFEVVSDHRGDSFRAVYAVRFLDRIFVLHAFQKKSKTGIATPKVDVVLIEQRLKQAVEISRRKQE